MAEMQDDTKSTSNPDDLQKVVVKKVKRTKKLATAEEIDKVQARRMIRKKTKIIRTKALRRVAPPARDIGIDVHIPEKSCSDRNCPFHGSLSVRGQIIDGTVVSDRMQKTVIVQKIHRRYVPKYERYEKRSSRYFAHNPPCIDAKNGESVRIMECRPLSKMKSFVVIERGI